MPYAFSNPQSAIQNPKSQVPVSLLSDTAIHYCLPLTAHRSLLTITSCLTEITPFVRFLPTCLRKLKLRLLKENDIGEIAGLKEEFYEASGEEDNRSGGGSLSGT